MVAGRRNLTGFTLIELLITIVILSLVVGIASFSFSLFSGYWSSGRDAFSESRGKYQRWDLLITALSDTIPWVVKNDQGLSGFYFLGRQDGLTLITESPIFDTRRPAVIRLFSERNDSGTFDLVYEEASLEGIKLRLAEQTLPFKHRMLIESGVSQISFRYFGWLDLQERLDAAEGFRAASPVWRSEYDGLKTIQHPERISVVIDDFEAVFTVSDRAPIGLKRAVGE